MIHNIQDLSLLIFGGKGGCGKTTSSCVTAVYFARKNPEKKILIASCDPAHSVGDSLGVPVGNTITPIESFNNLWALEMDSEVEFSEFKAKYEEVINSPTEKLEDVKAAFDKSANHFKQGFKELGSLLE